MPTNPTDDKSLSEDDKDNGVEPMLVTAFVEGEPVTSLTIETDPKDDTNVDDAAKNIIYNYGPDSRTNAGIPTLKLEIDNSYPPRLVKNPYAISAVQASCRYRVYPASSGSYPTVTSGSSRLVTSNNVLSVKETLIFSNSAISTLRHKPAGGIIITAIGSFIDQWGNTFTPTFVAPKEEVETVVWINSNTYQDPKPKTLNEFEVAVVGTFRKTIQAWGLAQVEYAATYDQYEFFFDRENNSDSKIIKFKDSYVFATYGSKVAGQLQLQGPSTRGRK